MPVVPAGAAAGAFASAKVLHKNIADRTVRLAFLNIEIPPDDDETGRAILGRAASAGLNLLNASSQGGRGAAPTVSAIEI
jgi:hypothetical protein